MNNEMILVILLGSVATGLIFALFFSLREAAQLRQKLEEKADTVLRLTNDLGGAKERARLIEDAHAAMSARFEILSQTASDSLLKRAEESFAAREKLALERMGHALKPVSETLAKFEEQVKTLEAERQKDTGGLKAQIEGLMQASQATRDVTHKLALALKRGAGVQGNWGEQTLKNVLEAAGLNNRYDFVEQLSVDDEHGKKLRPDVVVNIPGGVFVIDAKVNLSAFLEATEAADETHRTVCLNRHAQGLQNHVNELSQKAYWDQFKGRSPDFVALFVPGDGLLSAALERDPALMSRAMDKKVIIVTPTTLFALCKAVAYGWRVEDQMHNSQKIADLGRELYSRLAIMGEHVGTMGRSLEQVVKKYNDFVGSLESRVLPKAREFETLSVDHQNKDIKAIDEIDILPKSTERVEALMALVPPDKTRPEALDL